MDGQKGRYLVICRPSFAKCVHLIIAHVICQSLLSYYSPESMIEPHFLYSLLFEIRLAFNASLVFLLFLRENSINDTEENSKRPHFEIVQVESWAATNRIAPGQGIHTFFQEWGN